MVGSDKGEAVEVRVSFVSRDPAVGIESLSDWLRGEPGLAGRVHVGGPTPGEGELGALADVLVVAVGSGGTLSVLATSLKAWLARPRGQHVRIRIWRDGGETVEIDADRIDAEQADVLLSQALGVRASEE
jgi:Effector Associated Constant Component 1